MKQRRGAAGILILLELIILIVVAAVGIQQHFSESRNRADSFTLPDTENTTEQNDTEEPGTGKDEEDADHVTASDITDEVRAALDAMTTEEKVAQIFMTTPDALTETDGVNVAGPGTRDALKEYPVAGLIYNKTHYRSFQQFSALMTGAQGYSKDQREQYLLLGYAGEDGTMEAVSDVYDVTPLAEMVQSNTAPEEAEHISVPDAENENHATLAEGKLPLTKTAGSNGTEAVSALQSGTDIIWQTEDFRAAYQAVLDAVSDGSIPMERLNEAAGHVLMYKNGMPAPTEEKLL